MSYAVNPASLWRGYGLLQKVIELPVEIIPRQLQQYLRRAVRINNLVLEVFAANVHVRHEAEYVSVFLEGERSLRFIVGLARRNGQVARKRAGGDHALLDRRFREVQTNARSVFRGLTVSGVVHLEDQHGTFLDQLRLSRLKHERTHARSPSEQHSVGIVAAALRTRTLL